MNIEAIARAPQERARNRGATARRLVGELSPYRSQLLGAFVLIVLGAVSQALGPALIARAIDRHIPTGDRSGLARTMLLLLAVYVVGSLATRGQIRQVGMVGQRVLARLRARLFESFQRLPLSYYDRRPIGDLISRVTNDVDTLNQLLSQGLTQLLGSLFSLVGILIAMLVLNVRLALVSYTIIPVMLLTTALFARGRVARSAPRARRSATSLPSCRRRSWACGRRRRSTAPSRTSPGSGGATPPTGTRTCRPSGSPPRSRPRSTC
jgi:ATP-binding cassette subfamily B protein/subfamily B ATP-binding cassette protein MsbA